MPPREGCVSKQGVRVYKVKELANTFSEEKRGDLELSSETSGNGGRQHDVPEDLEEELVETVRVTTRARLNYELYRYSKNAMLIVTSAYDVAYWRRLVTDLKRTFESFRFEVEVAIVPDAVGLYAKCEQYFQKDFTDYGAAALVIVTSMAVNAPNHTFYPSMPSRGPPYSDDNFIFFEESRVVETFMLDRNPTLVNKPKIYITEANRRSPCRSYHDLPYLDGATYGDVIGFHVPVALPDDINKTNLIGSYDDNPRPLKMLCDKMSAAADNNSMSTIMEEIIEDAKTFPMMNIFPIEVVNNLSKELYFARTEN